MEKIPLWSDKDPAQTALLQTLTQLTLMATVTALAVGIMKKEIAAKRHNCRVITHKKW